MSNTSVTYPTVATDGGGPFIWTNPNNALAVDGAYATASTSNDQVTNYLNFTGFGFSIPNNAIINGVVFELGDFGSATTLTDSDIYLLKAGVQTGINKATNTSLNPSLTNIVYGGSGDLWGASLSSSDINNSNFGVQIRFICNALASKTVSVDYGRLTIYYTPVSNFLSPAIMCSI